MCSRLKTHSLPAVLLIINEEKHVLFFVLIDKYVVCESQILIFNYFPSYFLFFKTVLEGLEAVSLISPEHKRPC